MADSTIIASDTAVSGHIEGADDLTVEGRVDGTLELSETLTIGPDGHIDGEVQARQVVIEGSFQGEITAGERVVLASTARATANIRAPLVEMADGALLRGELTVGVERSARSPATRSRPATTTSSSARPTSAAPASSARTSTSTSAATTTTTVVEERTEGDTEEEESDESDQPALTDDTLEEYREKFTVKELRSKLRDRDLRVSGTKDELIERLVRAGQ